MTAKAVGSARRIVGELVCLWGLEPLADRAGLALSELLTNVVKHVPPSGNTGAPSARLVLTRVPGDGLFLCVHDAEPAPPRMSLASLDDEDGRGMHLIAAYADEYGVTTAADGGKDVWVTFFHNEAQ
ncbi:ATP-binding protein [Streptomyces sp. NPDC057620]|uniref:ATP-binding protein n=1 Tax=Streptomyces sp. NPDC057620 TaxID=3346185 RepID=UPI003677E2F3